MAALKVNKMIPIMAIAFLAIVVTLFLKTNANDGAVSRSTTEAGVFMRRAPVARTADADTPNDTIRALRGQMNVVTDSVRVTQSKNEQLMAERDAALKKIAQADSTHEARLLAALKAQDEKAARQLDDVLNRFNDAVNSMTEKAAKLNSGQTPAEVTASLASPGSRESTRVSLPAGFGHGLTPGAFVSGEALVEVFWIEPLDESINHRRGHTLDTLEVKAKSTAQDGVNNGKKLLLEPLQKYRELVSNTGASAGSSAGSGAGSGSGGGALDRVSRGISPKRQVTRVEGDARRFYTIPDLSMLSGSTVITSLVGKIYTGGDIVEPQLFKIIVGRENFAANATGLPPEIDGMIFEGYAVGNFTRRCVTGNITAATYIFEDGTVRSIYPGDPGSRPRGNDQNRGRLGYITDRYGNPCIRGSLISDVNDYLGAGAVLATLGAYSAAIRDSQTNVTDRFDEAGNLTSSSTRVAGNVDKFALAAGALGGIEAGTQVLEDIYSVSESAIYRPAGAVVDIHIQQELRLDVSASQRKVRYSHESLQQNALD